MSRSQLHEHLMSGRAWEEFCDRIKALGSEVLRDDVPGSPLDRAEGYRHLTRVLACALQQVIEFSDTDRPIFYVNPGLSVKWGGDNADNLYQHAAIDGSKTYCISGLRGTVHDFIISASAAGPMEAAATRDRKRPDHLVFAELHSRDLSYRPDGSFELIVSPERHEGNWLPSHPDVGFVLVRQYFNDWDQEQNAAFRIERIGFDVSSPPPLTAARMAEMLDDAAEWIERLPYWTRMIQRGYARAGDNALEHAGSVRGGGGDIHYGQGYFHLAEDDALLIECEPPEARYWQFQLVNWWFETLDYAHRQTSLTGHQAHLDSDGLFRAVVAHRDPGVPNWLDTGGHCRGLIQWRWVWTQTDPEPSARRIPLEQLRGALPEDTPSVTPEERQQTIRRRREHVLRRYHLY
jgi:hypothetical protein